MIVSLADLVPVYLAFVLKHLLADFILQSDAMAAGKGAASGWVRPLLAHAGIHAAGTLLIVLVVSPALWWLGPLDLAVHAAIDRVKGAATRRLALTPADKLFWWGLGLDQAAHQLTHFGYVLLILSANAA